MKENELKLEDVMCGDWVDVRNNAAPNTPHLEKITPSHLLRDEHWYGIELTPEILEKNGIKWFCSEPSGKKTYCCNGPVVQCTYIPNSGWLINVGACGSIKVRFVEISKIQYVHELQHALRLCGIEGEIVL